MLETVQKAIKKIDENKNYSTREILEMQVMVDGFGKPSKYVLYRFMQGKKLNGVNLGASEKIPRLYVKGRDLKNFLNKRLEKLKMLEGKK